MATELDSLDGRKDPQRCTLLVNQFRSCQVCWLFLLKQKQNRKVRSKPESPGATFQQQSSSLRVQAVTAH